MDDTYTKFLLTIIAVFLGAIAVQGAIRPAVGQYSTGTVRISNTGELGRAIAGSFETDITSGPQLRVYCTNCWK